MYKADQFTRKPTKAASIAMWVKSRKPGLVRWFDVDDSAGLPAKGSTRKLVKVPKNQWIHLAGTFDSKDGIARVYVNGKLISETVGKKNKGLPDDFTATGIGEKFGDKFISFLDDVFMFDRVISPAEVRVLYRKCEFNRMVLHFGFQKVNTTTHQVMDQSGLDNNATLDGGTEYRQSVEGSILFPNRNSHRFNLRQRSISSYSHRSHPSHKTNAVQWNLVSRQSRQYGLLHYSYFILGPVSRSSR